jgi:hypothetical protein
VDVIVLVLLPVEVIVLVAVDVGVGARALPELSSVAHTPTPMAVAITAETATTRMILATLNGAALVAPWRVFAGAVRMTSSISPFGGMPFAEMEAMRKPAK